MQETNFLVFFIIESKQDKTTKQHKNKIMRLGVRDFPFRSSSNSPATAPEKFIDDVKPHVRWETQRGRYDAVSSSFASVRNQGYQSRRN